MKNKIKKLRSFRKNYCTIRNVDLLKQVSLGEGEGIPKVLRFILLYLKLGVEELNVLKFVIFSVCLRFTIYKS
jgi:hypothetical protein